MLFSDLTIKIRPNEPVIETEDQYRRRIVKQVKASGATVEHVSIGHFVDVDVFDENAEDTGWYFFPFGSYYNRDPRSEGIGPNFTEFEAYENCWFYLAEHGLLNQDIEE